MNELSNSLLKDNTQSSIISLEKAHLDFANARIQLGLGVILILCFCCLNFVPVITGDFTLGDLPILNKLFLSTKQPVTALPDRIGHRSLVSDGDQDMFDRVVLSPTRSIWQDKAFGYHLENFVLYSLCCLFVSLLALEFTGLYGNRVGASAAIWAGLLFAAYPAHALAVGTLAGTSNLSLCLISLIGVFSLFRFRLLREKQYAWIAGLCLFVLVISGIVFLNCNGIIEDFSNTQLLPAMFGQLFIGLSNGSNPRIIGSLIGWSYLVTILLVIARAVGDSVEVKTILKGSLLAAEYVILTSLFLAQRANFDIALFFSVPLCLLITVFALPCVDRAQQKLGRVIGVVAVASLSTLLVSWLYLQRLETFGLLQSQKTFHNLRLELSDLSKEQKVSEKIFWGGPSGFGQSSSLACLCSPPFSASSLDASSYRFIDLKDNNEESGLLLLSPSLRSKSLYWSEKSQSYLPWHEPVGDPRWQITFGEDGANHLTFRPANTRRTNASNWRVISLVEPTVEVHKDFLRIYPGADFKSGGLKILLPKCQLNPVEANLLEIKLRMHSANGNEKFENKCHFLWSSHFCNTSPDRLCDRPLPLLAANRAHLELSRDRDWLLGGTVEGATLQFLPGNYCVDLYALEMKPAQ